MSRVPNFDQIYLTNYRDSDVAMSGRRSHSFADEVARLLEEILQEQEEDDRDGALTDLAKAVLGPAPVERKRAA